MISERDVRELRDAGLIDEATAESIRAYISRRYADRPRFDPTHVAYYFGALIVMLAFTWLIFEGYERYAGGALMMIAPSYAVLFVLAGEWLWKQRGLRIPGGLLFTLAVCMVPVTVYGFEEYMGWYPVLAGSIDELPSEAERMAFLRQMSWANIWIALATVVAGAAAIPVRRFAFMAVVPIVAFHQLWLAIVAYLVGGRPSDWDTSTHLMLSGLLVMAIGYVVDRRTREDFAFWLYGLGVAHFWAGLTGFPMNDELAWLGYAFVCLLLVGVSILLQRRIFLVAGGLGLFVWLGHLGLETFADSLLFPFVLSFVGLGVIALAVWYQRHKQRVDDAVIGHLPEAVRKRLPSARPGPRG